MKNQDLYLIKTEDGTSTLFHKSYEQAMHSTSGAFEESLLKHVKPSRVLDSEEERISVLDIGFGLGYNILALIYEYYRRNRNNYMEILSLEKERSFTDYIESLKFGDTRDSIYSIIQEAYIKGTAERDKISVKIIFGDARESLRHLEKKKFDAVFQDPFSPAKNPELWSVEYFKKISGLMKKDAVLTTYSSADQVRRAMLEGGLLIGKGPSVGKKREGTLAGLSEESIRILDQGEINKIFDNIRSVPYRDKEMADSRNMILERRLDEIREIKNKIKECHQAR